MLIFVNKLPKHWIPASLFKYLPSNSRESTKGFNMLYIHPWSSYQDCWSSKTLKMQGKMSKSWQKSGEISYWKTYKLSNTQISFRSFSLFTHSQMGDIAFIDFVFISHRLSFTSYSPIFPPPMWTSCSCRSCRNREAEEKLMEGVEGWEVGTWYGHPIYKVGWEGNFDLKLYLFLVIYQIS